MPTQLREGGSALRPFAIVILAVVAVAGAVVPTAANAVTAYFSQVKTVKATFGDATGNSEVFVGWKTAWCPVGYKVTGGGFETLDGGGGIGTGWITGSTPTSNSSGRQGWRVRFTRYGVYNYTAHATIYAQCIR